MTAPDHTLKPFKNHLHLRGHPYMHKSAEGQGPPFSGQTHLSASVMGMPSAVKPLSTATRTWNSAT